MIGLRTPVIAGVAGGVGTSTVAAALHALDAGRCGAEALAGVDVLVCRGTGESLRRADALAGPLMASGPRPVLAVTAGAGVPRDPLLARLRDIEPQFSGVLMLPYVGRWCEVTDPHVEAAALLAEPPERLPRPLRAYAGVLRLLARTVVDGRRLDRAAIPAPLEPRRRVASLWRGLYPIERARSLLGDGPAPLLPVPDLDDDELEAGSAASIDNGWAAG
ncbi:MAG: hypothetical protein ACRDRH_22630 [Pseudonocardia sp.]